MVIGDRQNDSVELEQADYQALMQLAQSQPAYAPLARMLAKLRLEPAAKRLATLAEQAQGIAQRLKKQPLVVEVQGHDVRFDAASWAPFWGSFVHVLRNAIDHGLESSEARQAAGKDRTARLRLSTAVQGDELVVEMADDGRGIDWDRIALIAAQKGVPHGSREELIEAIFYDGITTSSQVNDLSGRGVGMGAVRAACEARGGTVTVHSEPGAGTRVCFRFPSAAASSRPQRREAQHAA